MMASEQNEAATASQGVPGTPTQEMQEWERPDVWNPVTQQLTAVFIIGFVFLFWLVRSGRQKQDS